MGVGSGVGSGCGVGEGAGVELQRLDDPALEQVADVGDDENTSSLPPLTKVEPE